MNFLYNVTLFFYQLLIRSASLFNKKAKQWVRGRKNWRDQLSQKRKDNEAWMWFHCSSLGEYEDCCEIFNQVRKDNPSRKTLLTFFSPSGFEVQNHGCDLIMYLPTDTKRNSKRFLDILKPEIIFFSRSELWFNFITEIRKRSIPAFLLSLKLDENSNFLKWPARILFGKCFKAFTHIYCQNETTKGILATYFNIADSSLTGNTRFDRIYKESLSAKDIPHLKKFVKDNFVIVAGSSLPKDEKIILQAFKHLERFKIKCIIVPHEIDCERMDEIVKKNGSTAIRYSNIESLSESHTILYVDFVGALKHLYKYADLAIVGGGFDRMGIHNIIEPSVYGVKTTFGPNHKNCQEALDLLRIQGAAIHHNMKELLEIVMARLANPSDDILENKIINYVKINTGGSSKIVDSIRTQFPGLI